MVCEQVSQESWREKRKIEGDSEESLSDKFSEIRNLPPEILRGIDLVAANTPQHVRSLRPPRVNLPSVEALSKQEGLATH
jgi:hypothetical protein